MAQCKKCGAELSSIAKFCEECGERVGLGVHIEDAQDRLRAKLRERFCLSLPSLEWLKERGLLSVAPSSPLSGVLSSEFRTSESERGSAGEALAARGARLGGPEVGENVCASEFREALCILGNPEARLDLSIWAPNQLPIIVPLFISQGRVVLGYTDRLSFCVGLPLEKDRLVEALISNLQSERDGADSIVVWPAHLRAGTLIWRGSRKTASDAVERTTAVNTMLRAGYNEFRAEKIIAALGKAHFLNESGGSLVLQSPYLVCMERLWSGHMYELRYTPLRESAGRSEISHQQVRRACFVGPPGQRLVCTTITIRARAGEAQLDSTNRTEEHRVLLFKSMSRVALNNAIHSLLSCEGAPGSPLWETSHSSEDVGHPGDETSVPHASRNRAIVSSTKSDSQIAPTCTRCGAPTGTRRFCTKCGKPVE